MSEGAVTASGRILARAGLVVVGAYLASRLLGYVRLLVLNAVFGAGPVLDAYNAAFRIPDAMFQLVAAGALGSALIPVLATLFHGEQHREAWRVVSTIVNLMLVALAVMAVVMFVAAPWLMGFITQGTFAPWQLDLAVNLSRIMLLSPVLLALSAVATSVLNAGNRFTAAAIAPLLYNVAVIVPTAVLGASMGVTVAAVGVVIGALLSVAVQVLPLDAMGYRYVRTIDVHDPATRDVIRLVAPRALGLGASQVTFIVNTMLASPLGQGAITIYTNAFTILQIPIGVIGLPIGVVLLPSLSTAIAGGDDATFGWLVTRALRLLLFIMLPVTMLAAVFPTQIAELLLQYGRFDHAAAVSTGETLLFFLGAMAPESLTVVLARAFYADHETRIPVAAALAAVGINVVLSIASVGTLGLRGLAMGIAVGAWVEAIVLTVLLARRTGTLDLVRLGMAAVTFLAGSLLAAGAASWVLGWFAGIVGETPGRLLLLVEIVLATAAGGAVYAAWCLVTRVPEVRDSLRLLRATIGGRAA